MPESTKELSGRELDAAVAERIMGWQRQDGYNYWMSFSSSGETFKLHALIATWKPSESIEAAMEVVEKMRRDHFRFACNDRCDPESGEWWAEFATLEYERGGQASAGTLPEAVCRAALAAIESKAE
jgi:hypothetical protein